METAGRSGKYNADRSMLVAMFMGFGPSKKTTADWLWRWTAGRQLVHLRAPPQNGP
jgi:hypothetical protein